LLSPVPTPTEVAHAQALQLVERYGVLTREAVLAEGIAGGFTAVYGVLKVLEDRGQVRRGYFVDGLGAAQFALPGAVDRLRAARESPDEALGAHDPVEPIALASTDAAQPFGAALSWPRSDGRPARSASSIVISRDGEPLVWFDRRGHHLVTFPGGAVDRTWIESLQLLVKYGRAGAIEVRKVDGGSVADAPDALVDAMRAAGFADGYRDLVYRA
jgi:ATP-dependent Lhr-like helicase